MQGGLLCLGLSLKTNSRMSNIVLDYQLSTAVEAKTQRTKGPVPPGFKTQLFLPKIETQRLDEAHFIYVEQSNDTNL